MEAPRITGFRPQSQETAAAPRSKAAEQPSRSGLPVLNLPAAHKTINETDRVHTSVSGRVFTDFHFVGTVTLGRLDNLPVAQHMRHLTDRHSELNPTDRLGNRGSRAAASSENEANGANAEKLEDGQTHGERK
jgi:hypothetical protein